MTEKKVVLISGYPKSGTIWATRLTAELLNCPSIGSWGHSGTAWATEGLDRYSEFECYQCHVSFHELVTQPRYKEVFRIICMVRDPRDIVVSGSYHFSFYSNWLNRLGNNGYFNNNRWFKRLKRIDCRLHSRKFKINQMIKMLDRGNKYIENCDYIWDKHVQTFFDQPNVLITKYEDLLSDCFKHSSQILNHCGVERSSFEIKEAISRQSFERKKKEFTDKKEIGKAKHLRKGETGDWQDHLSIQSAEKIKSRFQSMMLRLGYL